MPDYTRKLPELNRISCPLPSFYNLLLRYDGRVQDHISFQHEAFTEQNAELTHRKIWDKFRKFSRKCMKKIPPYRRFKKIVYGSSKGFPVARMPDNSEIITINQLDDEFILHFAWIVENGAINE